MAAIVPDAENRTVADATDPLLIMAQIYAGINGSAHFTVDVENGTNPGEDGIRFSHVDSVTYPASYVIRRNGNVIEYGYDEDGGLTLDGTNAYTGGSAKAKTAGTLFKNVTTIAGLTAASHNIHMRYTADVVYFEIMNDTNQWQAWCFEIGYNWIFVSNMTNVAIERVGVFCGIPRIGTSSGTDYMFATNSTSSIHLGGADHAIPHMVVIQNVRIWTSKQPGIKPSHFFIQAQGVDGGQSSPAGFAKYFMHMEATSRAPKYINPSASTNQGWMRIYNLASGQTYAVLWNKTVTPA